VVGRHRNVLELIEHDGLVSATQIGPVRVVEGERLREIQYREVEAHVAPVLAEPPHASRDNTINAAHTEDASVMDDGLLNAVVHRITQEVVPGFIGVFEIYQGKWLTYCHLLVFRGLMRFDLE
jgi:hypothetical protein